MASLITSLVHAANKGRISRWICFLTSINHLFVTLYGLSCLCMVVAAVLPWLKENGTASVNPRKSPKGLEIFTKVHWFLFNVSAILCSFVFLGYWTLFFPTDKTFRSNAHPTETYSTIDRHGINLLVVFVDFFLSCTPVRLLHFIYPSIVIALFFVYNCIYWAITDDLIYGSVFDYGENTGKAVGLVLASIVIISPLLQFCWFLLYLLRQRLSVSRKVDEHPYELADRSGTVNGVSAWRNWKSQGFYQIQQKSHSNELLEYGLLNLTVTKGNPKRYCGCLENFFWMSNISL